MTYEELILKLKDRLAADGAYPIQAQAMLSTQILKDKLELVLPWAMEASGFDFWLVLSRENNDDPIHSTLVTWDMLEARRVSILAFHRDSKTGAVRRMCVGSQSPEMDGLYENVQQRGESVWEATARILRECDPSRIAVNRSLNSGYCDGLTATLFEQLKDAIDPCYRERIEDGEALSVRWLERVTSLEKKIMECFCAVTHAIIDYTFSTDFIIPGKTTTTDIEWCMRRIINELGYNYWFGPDVDLQRRGSNVSRMFNETIQPGDLLHCDIGINGQYVHLHTDMQWVAYILREGETEAPQELQALLDTGNRFRQIVMDSMVIGKDGNAVFDEAMRLAKLEGIQPMLYTHPIGTFGHGAGPAIGMYTNQGFVAGTGERVIDEDTCFALELNVYDNLACWDGQRVFMYLEEDICRAAECDYIDGHQTKLMLL